MSYPLGCAYRTRNGVGRLCPLGEGSANMLRAVWRHRGPRCCHPPRHSPRRRIYRGGPAMTTNKPTGGEEMTDAGMTDIDWAKEPKATHYNDSGDHYPWERRHGNALSYVGYDG